MGASETRSIAVCAISPKELDGVVRVVREAGGWAIVPVQWPDLAPLHAARDSASAFVLHTGDGLDAPAEELTRILVSRPERAPLIVLGGEPARRAAPTCWLPSIPTSTFLGAIINQLMTSA